MMSFYLSETTTRIGRDAGNDIALLHDSRVSRYHAEIRREGNSYVLHDLNSKNGTQVNGHRVTRHTLADGDRIRIGNGEIVYRAGELLLPADAVTGPRKAGPSTGAAPGPAAPTAAIVALVGLLAMAVLLVVPALPKNTPPPPTATPVPGGDTAEGIARRWVHSHLDQIADEITAGAYPQLPPGTIEYAVLHDKVQERIASDVWTYTPQGEVTEGVYRVQAMTTFGVGMVTPPDYSINAVYVVTVDTNQQRVKEYSLAPVSVVESR
jgi:hypothetical protein